MTPVEDAPAHIAHSQCGWYYDVCREHEFKGYIIPTCCLSKLIKWYLSISPQWSLSSYRVCLQSPLTIRCLLQEKLCSTLCCPSWWGPEWPPSLTLYKHPWRCIKKAKKLLQWSDRTQILVQQKSEGLHAHPWPPLTFLPGLTKWRVNHTPVS